MSGVREAISEVTAADNNWIRVALDNAITFVLLACSTFSGTKHLVNFNQQVSFFLPLAAAAAIVVMVMAKLTSIRKMETCLIVTGYFFTTLIVVLMAFPKNYTSPFLEPFACLVAAASLYPFLRAIRNGTHLGRTPSSHWVEDLMKLCWKTLGGALFVAIGRGSLISETALFNVNLYAVFAYFCLQQASFMASTEQNAKMFVCLSCYLQLAIVVTSLLGDSWPKLCSIKLVLLGCFVVAAFILGNNFGIPHVGQWNWWNRRSFHATRVPV